jgi:hypothetical protein
MLDSIIDDFYIIGAYPWMYTSEPTVLYLIPADDSFGQALAQFVLSSGCNFSMRSFKSSRSLFQILFDRESTSRDVNLSVFAAVCLSVIRGKDQGDCLRWTSLIFLSAGFLIVSASFLYWRPLGRQIRQTDKIIYSKLTDIN